MKKFNLKSLIAGFLIGAIGATTVIATTNVATVLLRDTTVEFEGVAVPLTKPLVLATFDGTADAHLYIPARELLERIGYVVEWDSYLDILSIVPASQQADGYATAILPENCYTYSWQNAYANFLQNSVEGEILYFSLHDIDRDGVLELIVMYEQLGKMGFYFAFYTYYNGDVIRLGEREVFFLDIYSPINYHEGIILHGSAGGEGVAFFSYIITIYDGSIVNAESGNRWLAFPLDDERHADPNWDWMEYVEPVITINGEISSQEEHDRLFAGTPITRYELTKCSIIILGSEG